ncbi:MAG: transglutaminase-like domain-containing protein [Chitinophagales bacterium]|nr:transglutaminase-like domain-containing protein [Chitinophagales bacterium]
MSQKTEIEALIKLLDDEDPEVYQNVSNRIISYGKPIVKELEQAWGESMDLELSSRIEHLVQIIQFESVKSELAAWAKDDMANLQDGAYIMSCYYYPDLSKSAFENELSKVKQKIWLELNSTYTVLQNIELFNRMFYNVLGFKGDYNNKVSTKDFFVYSVLENKLGNSISLGILYIILAQQLELPVYGVNLYRHFILAVQQHFIYNFDHVDSKETLCYLNPINKGVVFNRNDINNYLKASNIASQDSFFLPASPQLIIRELLYYLKFHFTVKNDETKVAQMDEFINILSAK